MSGLESSYKILPKHNLVIQCHSGVLKLNSYINFISNLLKDPEYTPNLNHIINIQNAFIKASLNDLNKYITYSENNFVKPQARCISVITETPNQVALSTLFKMLQKNTFQKIEIFSTIEGAIDWLKIDSNHSEIQFILNKLQEKT